MKGAFGVYAEWATASALKEQLDQCVEEIKTLRTEVTETKATIGTVSEKLDQVQLIKVALDTISEKVSTLGQLQQIKESLDSVSEKVNTLGQLQHTNQVALGTMEEKVISLDQGLQQVKESLKELITKSQRALAPVSWPAGAGAQVAARLSRSVSSSGLS